MEGNALELTTGKVNRINQPTPVNNQAGTEVREERDNLDGSIAQDELLKEPEASDPYQEGKVTELRDRNNLKCYILCFCFISLILGKIGSFSFYVLGCVPETCLGKS